jgi:hypothetical protein
MRARHITALIGIVAAFAVALPATATGGHPRVVATATGAVHWTIELPNPFGVEVRNEPLAFAARRYADGSAAGYFVYRQIVEGQSFSFLVEVTCMGIYDGNRAKIGGVIRWSDDATQPPGRFAWFQVFDNGGGRKDPPDRSSLVGFGDEVANEAFCNSPNLPRFGPWDVHGNVRISP